MPIPIHLQRDINDGMDPELVMSFECVWCGYVPSISIIEMLDEDQLFDEMTWLCDECQDEGDDDD